MLDHRGEGRRGVGRPPESTREIERERRGPDGVPHPGTTRGPGRGAGAHRGGGGGGVGRPPESTREIERERRGPDGVPHPGTTRGPGRGAVAHRGERTSADVARRAPPPGRRASAERSTHPRPWGGR